VESEITVLIFIDTQSCDLTEFQYVTLEELFVETYNDFASRECSLDEAARVVSASIDRDTSSKMLTCYVIAEGNSLFYQQDDGYVCSSLSEEAFALAYDDAVQSKRGDLESCVEHVNTVVEMEVAPCPDNTQGFQPNVVVSFIGDPTLSSAIQLDALSQAFRDTYNVLNRLNPETCDPLFRLVEQATVIEEDGFNRRLEDTFLEASSQRGLQTIGTRFSFLYRVTGQCRGDECSSNTLLFDTSTSDRELYSLAAVEFPWEEAHWRILQEADEVCMCPVAATEQRAPTQEEFLNAYQATVARLSQDSILDAAFIESVVDVREVEQVECGPPNTFDTQVFVELSGKPELVTQVEIAALEQSFGNTFKQLAANFCDPFFRTPVDVTIDTSPGRSRLLQSSTLSTFLYQYAVRVNCRGCERDTRLFGETVGRMLSLLAGENYRGRFQQANDCFCSLDVIADRSPSADEFAVAYNETVQELDLPNINYVLRVVESDDEPRFDDQDDESLSSKQSKKEASGRVETGTSSKSSKRSKHSSPESGGRLDGTKGSKSRR
jgi:hypothetical protein